jgi:hypothetical protein
MTQLTILQASKIANKSVVTLYRHIKDGKLSCSINKDGTKMIDLSELSRVYDLSQLPESNNEKLTMKQLDTTEIDNMKVQIVQLHEIINSKELLLQEKEKRIELLTHTVQTGQNQVKSNIIIYVVITIVITTLAVNLAWFMPNLNIGMK